MRFDIGTEFNQVGPVAQSWADVKSSIKKIDHLVKLKDRFDSSPNFVFESELKPAVELSE